MIVGVLFYVDEFFNVEFFFFSSRRRHTRYWRDWSSDVCSSDLEAGVALLERAGRNVRLTEAGQVLVRHAASLLDGVEAAEAELADLAAGQVAGVVRVAAFQSAFLRIVA